VTARLEGRQSGRELAALARTGTPPAADAAGGANDPDDRIELASPLVGHWRPQVLPGHVVVPGDLIGDLDVLGQIVRVVAPAQARGAVIESTGAGRARTPVGWGQRLYLLDPSAGAIATAAPDTAAAAAVTGLVFTAPTSGRFYSRSGPGKTAFVAAGDVITEGQTLCLIEVMKTFHRVTYGGAGLPARARVAAVLITDEADVAQGDPILRLEEIP